MSSFCVIERKSTVLFYRGFIHNLYSFKRIRELLRDAPPLDPILGLFAAFKMSRLPRTTSKEEKHYKMMIRNS